MAKKGSKKKEVKPEDDGATFVYEDEAKYEEPLFVPTDVKLERVKKQVKADRIKKDKEVLDFWLRHTLGLGTKQIKQLWKKLDVIYR